LSVQFPTLSQAEQQARYSDLAKKTLFPYSYPFAINPSTANFTGPGPSSPLYDSMSIGLQADNNFSISCLSVQVCMEFENATSAYLGNFGIEVSYSPVPVTVPLAPTGVPAIPTTPIDVGNVIYHNFQAVHVVAGAGGAGNDVQTMANINDFWRFEPYNYLLKFNQILYIHFLVDNHTVAVGSSLLQGSVILHTLATGLKI
jgi:hypothetical protein